MFPETFRVIWRNGPNFQNREAWAQGVYNAPSYETDVPNFPWCSAFVVFISILIGSQNICVKTREQKNTCTDRNKTVSERTTWQCSGHLWNINVVVRSLTGLDKNWTVFKKKRRTASKASATGMILVQSGFSVADARAVPDRAKSSEFSRQWSQTVYGYGRQNRSRDDRS